MLPREYLRENAERLLREMPERFAGAGLERYAALERMSDIGRISAASTARAAAASSGDGAFPRSAASVATGNLAQDLRLFARYRALRDSSEFAALDAAGCGPRASL